MSSQTGFYNLGPCGESGGGAAEGLRKGCGGIRAGFGDGGLSGPNEFWQSAICKLLTVRLSGGMLMEWS